MRGIQMGSFMISYFHIAIFVTLIVEECFGNESSSEEETGFSEWDASISPGFGASRLSVNISEAAKEEVFFYRIRGFNQSWTNSDANDSLVCEGSVSSDYLILLNSSLLPSQNDQDLITILWSCPRNEICCSFSCCRKIAGKSIALFILPIFAVVALLALISVAAAKVGASHCGANKKNRSNSKDQNQVEPSRNPSPASLESGGMTTADHLKGRVGPNPPPRLPPIPRGSYDLTKTHKTDPGKKKPPVKSHHESSL